MYTLCFAVRHFISTTSIFVSRILLRCFLPLLVITAALTGCTANKPGDNELKVVIMRYNQLVSDGYRKSDMNPLQEVTTHEQAEKLYLHMAAIGEGQLLMDSKLKDISFVRIDMPDPDSAQVATKETWDFSHVDRVSGKKVAEEKDFVYEMGYSLKKTQGRWFVVNVNTVSGRSTNTVIPFPEKSAKGDMLPPGHGEKR